MPSAMQLLPDFKRLSNATYLLARYDTLDRSYTDEDRWRIQRVNIASRTGWSFEYIDNLSWGDVEDLRAVWDGQARASQ